MEKEEILDRAYISKMHWQTVNRKRVLDAMDEYATLWAEKAAHEKEGLVKALEYVKKHGDRLSAGIATKALEQYK